MLTKSKYFKQAKGQKIDVDGVPASQPYQCVDVIKDYMKKCYNIPYFSINNDAKNYYEQFNNFKYLVANFSKIANSASFVPRKGDIVVWNSSKGGGHGHVAIAEGSGNTKYFYSYDQNWDGPYVARVKHDYSGVLGVLRPKNYIAAVNINVRSGPGTSYSVVDEDGVKKGEIIKPIKIANGWAQIDDEKWVCAKYLD